MFHFVLEYNDDEHFDKADSFSDMISSAINGMATEKEELIMPAPEVWSSLLLLK